MRDSKTIKKTRKVHVCSECKKEIPIGSSCTEEFELIGSHRNGVDRWYICNACEKHADWVECEVDCQIQKDCEFEEFNTSRKVETESVHNHREDNDFEYEFEAISEADDPSDPEPFYDDDDYYDYE